MDDLEIIKLIENQMEIELKELSEEEFNREYKTYADIRRGYLVKEYHQVTGLRIEYTSTPPLALIQQLTTLEGLILRHVSLKDISFLKELKGLTALNLSDNSLQDVTFLKELKGLTALSLSGNREIKDFTFLKELKGLTMIHLAENGFQDKDVTFLKKLKGLTALYLGNNNLQDVTFLKDMKGLTSLDLSENKEIKDFTFLKELKNLRNLYLRENNLEDISFLKDMENLTSVYLEGNPIKEPPKEIVSQGIDSIRDYFKALEGEKQLLKEVKVLLVGEGGAGKTSLLKQLKGKEFNKNEPQTHGINIEDLPITVHGSDALIHIWDFGGQEIMHASHQFFLSKRSLYILVTDCRKDDKIEHWLKHIRSFGGDSPVLVVINKIDQNPSFDVNRQHLQEKYKNIRGFYKLSCASQKGLEEFTSQMINEIESVEYMRTQWAKSWFTVKEYLQNMNKNYITYDRYYEICDQNNVIGKSQQNTLLEYLHNLGVILHFEDFALKDYQVLDPKWVTEAVYKVINSEKLAECKGYLDKNMLEHILNVETFNKEEYHALLKNTKYTPLEQHYIISLMKTFELCYPVNDDTFPVPDLLAVQEPGFVKTFDKKNALKFLYQFDFLPPSIIPRFIVKMNSDIKDQDLQWRTGVVLQYKNTGATAVVKEDKEAKKIYIYVSGEYKQKREYLSVLRHALRDLIDSFEKLQVTEGVPLPDNEDIVIEYEELKGYEEAGKDEYFIGKLKKTYSVGKLLDGIEPPQLRQRGYHGPPVNINIDNKPYMEFKPELYLHTESSSYSQAEARSESTFQLELNLPALQSQFDDLKLLLEEAYPRLAKRLDDVDHELYQVDSKSDQKKLKRPLTKLGNLLRELGDEKSGHSKFLKGAGKVLDCAQKLGRTYNKFAKWIPTLPQIPGILVGKK